MKLVHLLIVLVILLLVSVVVIVHLHRGPISDLEKEVTELKARLSDVGEEKERSEEEIQKRTEYLDDQQFQQQRHNWHL